MSKKYVWISLVLLVVFVGGFALFRVSNPNVGFTYYEPSYLPPHISIKAKRINVDTYSPIQVEQNFRTEDWVYSISEYKANKAIGSAAQNYDEKSIKPTCNIETSAAMHTYRLCHWVDYGKIDVHEIKFIKLGTFVRVQIPSSMTTTISVDEIGKFVDSFQEKSTVGIPVLRTNGA